MEHFFFSFRSWTQQNSINHAKDSTFQRNFNFCRVADKIDLIDFSLLSFKISQTHCKYFFSFNFLDSSASAEIVFKLI